ncbi:MAG TPA: EH signature domain-containing protein [Candidatus Obscuribacter sp.]|nr:EH signature domain-containing protein [Candidatus Obscuribacter sp.]
MSSEISKQLQQIDSAREYLDRFRESKLRYESSLAKIRSKSSSIAPPKEATIQIALLAWNQALSSNNFDSISKRTLRTLCCVSDVVVTESFIDLLKKLPETSPRMLRDLIGVYLETWEKREKYKFLGDFIQDSLSSANTTSKLINVWKEHKSNFLGEQAASSLADKLATNLEEIEDYFERVYLPRKHSSFSAAVALTLAKQLGRRLDENGALNEEVWDFFQTYLLVYPTFQKKQRDAMLAILVKRIEKHRHQKEWEPLRNYLRDLVLKSPELGDPRIETVKWKEFDAEARQIVISWLAEEDIGLFFELIIKRDPHKRKPYWLRYVKEATNSLVIVGEADFKYHAKKLEEFSREGRTFSRGYGLPTSAFIMDFGAIAIVEFSEVGNACYVYNRKDMEKLLKTTNNGWKDIRELKDKEKAIWVQRHHPSSWVDTLDDQLQVLGVEPRE